MQIYKAQRPEIFNQEILLSSDSDAKPVAWQHYGVYLGNQSNIYHSNRTNKNKNDIVEFDHVPEFGEIIKEPFGNDLICVVPLTLLTNNRSTYPKTDISTLVSLQTELENINIDRYNFNPQVNLASAIITWKRKTDLSRTAAPCF